MFVFRWNTFNFEPFWYHSQPFFFFVNRVVIFFILILRLALSLEIRMFYFIFESWKEVFQITLLHFVENDFDLVDYVFDHFVPKCVDNQNFFQFNVLYLHHKLYYHKPSFILKISNSWKWKFSVIIWPKLIKSYKVFQHYWFLRIKQATYLSINDE